VTGYVSRLCRLMCGGGSAPPEFAVKVSVGLRPEMGHSPTNHFKPTEGHKPSAHQAAEPHVGAQPLQRETSPTFRSYGAGTGLSPTDYKHLAPNGARVFLPTAHCALLCFLPPAPDRPVHLFGCEATFA
jgi:hypothetical protein